MPVYNIHHITKYEYDRPVKESVNEIRICPYTNSSQETLHHEVNITDQPDVMMIHDYWGNSTGMFNLLSGHRELIIESKLIVRTLANSQPATANAVDVGQLKQTIVNDLSLLELAASNEPDLREEIAAHVSGFYQVNMPVAGIIENSGNYIFNHFSYIKGITNIETTLKEILALRSGVCQDFAHVMLEMLRSLGIPSRHVSGYICPDKKGMRGEGATHAWVEAWIPNVGWLGYDPTNNVWVSTNHVKLAVGRNFKDCSPMKGSFKGPARQSLSVYVAVGYEDGHVFEELNNVKMQSVPGFDDPPGFIESFAGQQQQ